MAVYYGNELKNEPQFAPHATILIGTKADPKTVEEYIKELDKENFEHILKSELPGYLKKQPNRQ